MLSGPSPLCGELSPLAALIQGRLERSVISSASWLPQTLSFHLVKHMFSPWQQKARDNRAAQRISKVQLSSDPTKRQQATPAPLPAAYEPACMEVEGGFKDPLKSRESEQEQEWKLRQVSFAATDFQTRTQACMVLLRLLSAGIVDAPQVGK